MPEIASPNSNTTRDGTSALFSNPEIQIQVCSPGRLDARRSALLAIGFYLGSDTLRRYTLGDLATSFAEHQHYPRGRFVFDLSVSKRRRLMAKRCPHLFS